MLLENLDRNRVTNVRAVMKAVAAERGIVCLYSGGARNLGASTIVRSGGSVAVARVEADRLEEIITADELAVARIVKLDLEGAEVPPLLGLLGLVDNLREDFEIIVELSPERWLAGQPSANEIIAAFEAKGFRAYDLQTCYSPEPYVKQMPVRVPRRIRHSVTRQTDIVFSRN